MRNRYSQQLAQLDRDLIAMGGMCETSIALAQQALFKDESLVGRLDEMDMAIHQQEDGIEKLCLQLLLQQQPVAGDLRIISAALKMITDMERIGHQAADMGEIIAAGHIRVADDRLGLKPMALAAATMVTASIDAFVRRDLPAASQVIADDETLDAYFIRVQDALAVSLAAAPDAGRRILDLLLIAKYFERIGDHAVNIAQWVVFSITGEHKDGDIS